MFSKQCNDRLETLMKSDVGKEIIKDFKDILLQSNDPANANDGILMAVSMARYEGSLDIIRKLIKIGERNNGK